MLAVQAGVNIYVLDSGVRVTHEQFGYLNGSAGSRAQSGYDFIDKDFNADDCTGKGRRLNRQSLIQEKLIHPLCPLRTRLDRIEYLMTKTGLLFAIRQQDSLVLPA